MSEIEGKLRGLSLLELLKSCRRGEAANREHRFFGLEWNFVSDFDGVNSDIRARGGAFEAKASTTMGASAGVVLVLADEDPVEWEATCTAEFSCEHQRRGSESDEDPFVALQAALKEVESDLEDLRSGVDEARETVEEWRRALSDDMPLRPEHRLRAIGQELMANAKARQGVAIVSIAKLQELFEGYLP